MWVRYPGKHKRAAFRYLALAGLGLALAAAAAFSAEKKGPAATAPAVSEAEFLGKFFCSLKRTVVLPFAGIITSLPVQTGQQVKAGQVLARYRLTPAAALEVSRRLSAPQIKDLEMRLAQVERSLPTVQGKNRELMQLSQRNLAPAQALTVSKEELRLLQKEKGAIQGRLAQERQLAQEDRLVLSELLGHSVRDGRPPKEAVLVAPLDGYVIYISPELQQEAEVRSGVAAFQIGVMDPMLVRAQIHEVEAARLSPGDAAEVSLESRPDRWVEARLTRLSWQPLRSELDQPAYYEAEFSVPNPQLTFKEGMKVRVALRKSH